MFELNVTVLLWVCTIHLPSNSLSIWLLAAFYSILWYIYIFHTMTCSSFECCIDLIIIIMLTIANTPGTAVPKLKGEWEEY